MRGLQTVYTGSSPVVASIILSPKTPLRAVWQEGLNTPSMRCSGRRTVMVPAFQSTSRLQAAYSTERMPLAMARVMSACIGFPSSAASRRCTGSGLRD